MGGSAILDIYLVGQKVCSAYRPTQTNFLANTVLTVGPVHWVGQTRMVTVELSLVEVVQELWGGVGGALLLFFPK